MHVACSQETVAAADSRDDKSMGWGGGGGGCFGSRDCGGGWSALAVSLEG